MKAAFINDTGAPDKIIYGDLPTPEPVGTQVLIKVGAVSVNPIDTYIRNGANYWELPKPYIVGSDVAGTVSAVGPEATRFKVGDRVWGTNQGLVGRQGTFSEFCAVDECWLYPTPDNVSDESAAAVALVAMTAYLGLFRDANLREGETLFVNGGTGGVGSMVVQMGNATGARVIATCGSDEKVEIAKELGADVAVNYKTENVSEAVSALAPDGVNVLWETTREPDFETLVGYLAERGRFVLMAGRDAKPPFPVGPFYVKGCTLHGFVMFKATPDEQRKASETINRWLSQGALRPCISHRFTLEDAAKAHQLQEDNTLGRAGTTAGKIVLTP
ncbi:MAG: NADPH:quinone reductase [Planctomycetales bacterium]|nr:NADPH:quinone reductase [Planctomycetales bacterium]